MIWGDPIEIGGVRPAWLADDVMVDWQWSSRKWHADRKSEPWNAGGVAAGQLYIENGVVAIRLPADHFAYLAIAKGYQPWGGGDSAPGDWDHGDVLLRSGDICLAKCITYWGDDGQFNDIIGYKRKQATDDGDYVSVKRMTKAEFHGLLIALGMNVEEWLSYVDIILPPTQAETIATKTGLTVDQVQSVLNEVNNGTR